jgi:hypothetical protein
VSGDWPRRRRVRHRHDPARWDPERTGEDLPSLGGTIALTALGLVVLVGLASWQPMFAAVVIGTLLIWSVAVDLTGNRVSSRVQGPVAIAVWALLRPAYAIGIVLWGLVEGVLDLFG